MAIYCLYIFDRHCECIFYTEWTRSGHSKSGSTGSQGSMTTSTLSVIDNASKNKSSDHKRTTQLTGQGGGTGTGNNLERSEEAKLVYGVVFSLRNMVRKLTENKDDTFLSYRTSAYKLHYYETPTGLKFVLMSDPHSDNLRLVLRQIYMSFYVEYVIKNPLSPIEHPGGDGVGNTHFRNAVDKFIRGLSAAK